MNVISDKQVCLPDKLTREKITYWLHQIWSKSKTSIVFNGKIQKRPWLLLLRPWWFSIWIWMKEWVIKYMIVTFVITFGDGSRQMSKSKSGCLSN